MAFSQAITPPPPGNLLPRMVWKRGPFSPKHFIPPYYSAQAEALHLNFLFTYFHLQYWKIIIICYAVGKSEN